MDPGNWATDLDATRYGDALLWSVLASGLAAMLLQTLVVRYVAHSGEDLMQGIARRWPGSARTLWWLYALAVVATELAEFVGLVVGLTLLLHISTGAAIAGAVAIFGAMLFTGTTTARRLERLALGATVVLAGAYAVDLALLHPATEPMLRGALVPALPGAGALLAVVGIAGATIMPHNLFLHGGLVLERLRAEPAQRRLVERTAIVETIVVLAVATVVNGAILVLGGAVRATTIERAYATLVPLAGPASAMLFGVALCVSALAATASGARAADVVCHAGAPVRLRPLTRRILAVTPAIALLLAGCSASGLIVASQVVLGLVLPTVVIPLLILARGTALHRTRAGFALVASSSAVVAVTLACDGVLLTSLLSHG
jgi:manganese transport protein